MEGSLLNQQKSVRASSHVLWHVWLTCNFSTDDGHIILQADNRKNRNLYGWYSYLHPNNGRTQEHSMTSPIDTSQQQTITLPQEMQILLDKNWIPWSCSVTR